MLLRDACLQNACTNEATETAQEFGYGVLLVEEKGAQDPLTRFAESLPESERQDFEEALGSAAPEETVQVGDVLVSASTTGCYAEARKKAYGSIQNFLKLNNLPGELTRIGTEIVTSQEYSEALKAYSQCMAKSDIDVASPKEALALARSRLGTRASTQPATPEEIAMAVTDARCQEQADLRGVLDDELIRRSTNYIIHHEAELMALSESLRESRVRAREALNALGND